MKSNPFVVPYPTVKQVQTLLDWLSSLTDEELIEQYEKYYGYPPTDKELVYVHQFVDRAKQNLPNSRVTVNFNEVDYMPSGWGHLFNKLLEVEHA